MRGENMSAAPQYRPRAGPSPHAWGKLMGSLQGESAPRTIPTCVGKTQLSGTKKHRKADHPHMRGENSVYSPYSDSVTGPSPHAWGKRQANNVCIAGQRTIPTCVGKTPIYQIVKRLKSVIFVFIFM